MLLRVPAPSGTLHFLPGKAVHYGLHTEKRRSRKSCRILHDGLRILRKMRKLQGIQRYDLSVLRSPGRIIRPDSEPQAIENAERAREPFSGCHRPLFIFFFRFSSFAVSSASACRQACHRRCPPAEEPHIPRSSPTRTTFIFFGGRQIRVVTI